MMLVSEQLQVLSKESGEHRPTSCSFGSLCGHATAAQDLQQLEGAVEGDGACPRVRSAEIQQGILQSERSHRSVQSPA